MYNKSERRTPWAAVVPWPRTFSTLSPLLPWNTPAVKWRRWLMSVDRGWFTSLSAGHLFYLFSASIALWAQSAPLLSHQQLLFSLSQSHHHYLCLFLCCHVLQPSISFSHPSVNLLFPVLSPLLFLSGASPISPTPAATWSNYLSPRPGQMWCFLIKIRKGKWGINSWNRSCSSPFNEAESVCDWQRVFISAHVWNTFSNTHSCSGVICTNGVNSC